MEYNKNYQDIASFKCERALLYHDSYRDARPAEKVITLYQINRKVYSRVGNGKKLYFMANQELIIEMEKDDDYSNLFRLVFSNGSKYQHWDILERVS